MLEKVLHKKSFLVCMGSGGVGKTTVSAAAGVLVASLGKKTLIVTIDPAKRLANAFGMDALAPEPTQVDPKLFEQSGVSLRAPLSVMMLDMGAAWDTLISDLSPDKTQVNTIFANRFYQYLSRELAGSQEFVACEALYRLHAEHDYDLIVLDTPPTVHALDFLTAPARIVSFLNQEAFRYFLSGQKSLAGKVGLRFLGGAGALAQSVLEKLTGSRFLHELTEFIHALQDIYPPLIERTQAFQDLLVSNEAGFCVVMQPKPASMGEAEKLYSVIKQNKYAFCAMIANGVMPAPKPVESKSLPAKPVGLAKAIEQAYREQSLIAQAEKQALESMQEWGVRSSFVLKLPQLMEDIHSPEGLAQLSTWL